MPPAREGFIISAFFVCSQGYSYIAPSVLFSENIISKDVFMSDKRPNMTGFCLTDLKVSLKFCAFGS